jgi:hypothetical protein
MHTRLTVKRNGDSRLLPLQAVAERMGYASWRSLKRRAQKGGLGFDILREGRRLVVRAQDFEDYMSSLRPALSVVRISSEAQEVVDRAMRRVLKRAV